MDTETTAPAAKFEPAKYLTQISGRDYLETKYRILWLRTLHPDAVIETELHRDDGTTAVFRARVVLPTGASATGWGSESYQDFAEYIEKAETKSLGRALAALGFGTQFCYDFDEAPHRPADSPVDIGARRQGGGGGYGGQAGGRNPGEPASEKQVRAIFAIGRALGLTEQGVTERAMGTYGAAPAELQRRDASAFIDLLNREQAGQAG